MNETKKNYVLESAVVEISKELLEEVKKNPSLLDEIGNETRGWRGYETEEEFDNESEALECLKKEYDPNISETRLGYEIGFSVVREYEMEIDEDGEICDSNIKKEWYSEF